MARDTRERDALICRLADEGLTHVRIAAALSAERSDWAVSAGQVSRILAARGRRRAKVRSDAGKARNELAADAEAALYAIKMGLTQTTPSKPGKLVAPRLPSHIAIREAEARGIIAPGAVSAAALNRRLRAVNIRQRGAEANRTGPHVVRRFEAARAGARYQFDGTLLGQFYVDAAGDIDYFPDTDEKAKLKLEGRTRAYVLALVDDHSRAMRLHACDGETARNIIRFCREVFTRGAGDRRPFHGLPSTLYTDNGSGATRALARAAWQALGVKLITHKPYSAWSKGKVEAAFRRTNGYQELMRGRKFRGFAELNDFVSRIGDELNSRPMDALGGRTPNDVFFESALAQAAEGRWRFAPDDDAFWHRLELRRVDGVLVRPGMQLAIGGGETCALPEARPYIDWIGRKISVLVLTEPGKLSRARGDGEPIEDMYVVDPEGRVQFKVPRIPPEVRRWALTAEDTSAQLLMERIRAACADGRMAVPAGDWIGAGVREYAEVPGVVAAPATASGAIPVEMIDAFSVKKALLDTGWLGGDTLDVLLAGRESIERTRLDAFLAEPESFLAAERQRLREEAA